MFSNMTQDFRFAARTLWRNRGFAASAILILTLGIAASTGLFAVLDAAVLHPVPFIGADRIARVRLVAPGRRPEMAMVNADQFGEVQNASTLDGVYIRESFTKTLSGASLPESVWTEMFSGNAPLMLGIQPLLGRVFNQADAPVGSEPQRVVVLTYPFWQRRFAGQSDAIGRTLRLDGEPFTVIGVIPRGYTADATDIVVPVRMRFPLDATWRLTVRLKPGVSIARAEAELQNIYEQFKQTRPAAYPPSFRVQLSWLVDEERGGAQVPVIGLLFGSAALLLLIGCANVTILLLARGRYRVREIAVRHALGAGRWRLVSLLLAETLLVTFAAAGLALVAVTYGLPPLLAELPATISQYTDRVVVGRAALLFATAVSALVSLIVGLWPALTASSSRSDAMRAASAARTVSGAGRASSGFLVATQVTIAVVLLAGTGAAIRSIIDLDRAPLGYDPTRLTIGQIHLQDGSYTNWPARLALYQHLLAEVTNDSAVESATLSLIPSGPPPLPGMGTRIAADGHTDDREVQVYSVASSFFSTLKMPLVRGTTWSAADDDRAEPVVVINETMARQFWPHEDPLGKHVREPSFLKRPQWILTAPGRDGLFEVIGVVRDAPDRGGLREPIAPAMYYPYTVALSDILLLSVRTKGSPLAAEARLRTAVSRADGNLPIIRFIPPERFTGREQGAFVSALLVSFAGIALLLASFGLFSVSSYTIANRTREFGIRIALGASRRAVLRLALQSTMIAVFVGLGFGLVLSVGLSSVLARWSIRNVDDPIVLVVAIGTLFVSTVIATVIPVRRATAIDPTIALRVE
jgi:predicted permease